jgi:uncharacterized 2Fe-2S/4Fe-4S cluster protein (DUF4445 family)
MRTSGYSVTFKVENGADAQGFAAAGESLFDAAQNAGVVIDAPCSGNGTCGKCRLKLLSGEAEGGDSGARHLSAAEYAAGWRLACATTPRSDVAVLVPASSLAWQNRIRITDFSGERERAVFAELRDNLKSMGFADDSGLSLVTLRLAPPSLDDPAADRERLSRALAAETGADENALRLALPALRKLPLAARESGFALACVLRRENGGITVLDVLPLSADSPSDAGLYGLAVDIGTTTVSLLLVNLQTGEPVAAASGGNGQIRYGADVINRIIESTRKGGVERLRKAVADECIVPLVKRLCRTAGIAPERIYRVALAANTTMTHLFLGVPAEHLRLEPYVPAFFCADGVRGAELRIGAHPDAEAVIAPAIGSYVGGDITAGVFASMLFRDDSLSLFIDLGTNAELVLGSAEFLMSCACSAGPAFEGGDIRCGMRATNGAVEACVIDADTMEPALTVIGAPGGAVQKPAGICGSGIIALIGELFRCGIINAKGRFVRDGARVRRDEWGGAGYVAAFEAETESGSPIVLSETDIDNFVRAKAAIFSAVRTMLAMLDMPLEAIARVYFAGGIGSGISVERAIGIGLFPNLPLERYRYIGNSSLSGAYAMLCSRGAAAKVAEISRSMTYIELSSHPHYMEEFVAACFLPHTDGSLFERRASP